jgi:hypothetical protein
MNNVNRVPNSNIRDPMWSRHATTITIDEKGDDECLRLFKWFGHISLME